MPDRVMRQLGHVQGIPLAPLAVRSERTKNQGGRKTRPVWYTLGEEWSTYSLRVIQPAMRGRRVRMPWDCTSEYESWFASQSHPRVQHPLRMLPRIAQAPAHVDDPQRLRNVRAYVRPLLYAEDRGVRTAARDVFQLAGGQDAHDDEGPSSAAR